MSDDNPSSCAQDDSGGGQGQRKAGRKAPDAYRTISEVADLLHVPQHVLRFWETRFEEVSPLKSGGGRRYYSPDQIDLLRRISELLYVEGYTIKGVQRVLKGNTAPDAASSKNFVPLKSGFMSIAGFAEDGAVPFDYSSTTPPLQGSFAVDDHSDVSIPSFNDKAPDRERDAMLDQRITPFDAVSSGADTKSPSLQTHVDDTSNGQEMRTRAQRQKQMLLDTLRDIRAELLALRKNLLK